MSKTLSVFFSTDRTYVTLTEKKNNNIELNHIDSTNHAINFDQYSDIDSFKSSKELTRILEKIDTQNIARIAISLPGSNALVTQFPGSEDMSRDNVRKLVGLEIRQAYPQFKFADFSTNVIPLGERKTGENLMVAVIISKQDYEICRELLQNIHHTIDHVEISQINAHSAFMHNYPEFADKNAALFGLQDKFVDISLIRNGKPRYFNLASMPSEENIREICESELDNILKLCCDRIDHAFFFGIGLNKDIFDIGKRVTGEKGINAQRLNAFRMLSTKMDERTRKYCERTAHIYPPCIGGSVPYDINRYKFY